jgi:nicotinate-nucleotide adenylyltransferase
MTNLKNKKIVVYGGTFNPIHIGHLLTGFDLLEKLNYDYVIYVPTNIPAHKNTFNLIDQFYRLKMIKLSIKGIKKFLVSDIEIKKGGISYTIDTIKELYDMYKCKNKIGVVFGDDLLNELSQWKEIDSLSKITDMICMYRKSSKVIKSKYKLKWLQNRIINISSSEIRERIKNNLPINFMVSEKVNNFILKKKLYI